MKKEHAEGNMCKGPVVGKRKTNMIGEGDFEFTLKRVELEASLRHSRGDAE